MRRSRRGLAGGGHEFGGSGEDSFVAVVVTKLTGALLFILLLTMVIMALIPKADEAAGQGQVGRRVEPQSAAGDRHAREPARGDRGPSLRRGPGGRRGVGTAAMGRRREAARRACARPGHRPDPRHARRPARPSRPRSWSCESTTGRAAPPRTPDWSSTSPIRPLTTPSRWKPGLPPIPWRAWMEQGFGFLVLLLVHLVGMNALAGLERLATNPESPGGSAASPCTERLAAGKRDGRPRAWRCGSGTVGSARLAGRIPIPPRPFGVSSGNEIAGPAASIHASSPKLGFAEEHRAGEITFTAPF